MTENMDMQLQSLFVDAEKEIEANGFVADVMTRTRFLKYRLPVLLGIVALVVVVVTLLLAPSLQVFAFTVATGLTTTLIDLGEGWLGFFLMPLNTVGSLLLLIARIVRVVQKKITGRF